MSQVFLLPQAVKNILGGNYLTRGPGEEGTQQSLMQGGSAPRSIPGGGGGVLNKCLYREAPPRGPTPYRFIYHFSRKRYPNRIPSIDEWYPFHIPCLELCIPFNCCKWTVFLTGINHKNRTFSWLYKAIKFICQPFWALSQRQMTDFPTLSYTSTSKIPTLKKIPQPEPWKRYPYRPS